MTAWVGTAKTLLGLKDRWRGTLMFIAQPAEETVSGAKAMLDDGLFTKFKKPDFGFALHDGPLAYGTLTYRTGVGSSNSDSLDITFRGRGGHGAAPQRTVDPVVIAARFIMDVQSVISREKDPTEFGVFSVGAIHGGTAHNIIPDDVSLRGAIRTFKPEVRAKMLAGIDAPPKPPPPCRMRLRPISSSPRAPEAVMNDTGVVDTR